jgi:hypothetical protein
MWAPVEGSQPFVRAVDSSGTVVLEQHFAWPRVEHRLPLGTYSVTVYERICVGNCDNLSPEGSARCEVPLDLEYHDDRRLVQVTWDDDAMACEVVRPF